MKSDKTYNDAEHSNAEFDNMLTDAQDGWKKLNSDIDMKNSIDRVNNFVNKTLDSKRKNTRRNRKKTTNTTTIWLTVVFILIFISLAIILKII